ncbi:PD-(D/E)XK nuclease family protein [Acinetobacter indicus]|uniref:PD-(D/E)XK nuclease family protein n=1 Tax=Acinetobacter indicus TaxID=756892 RepID=UPI001443E4A1|nr:PD-(D/E)XK nuclease family protein [Acinetobacter indicus]
MTNSISPYQHFQTLLENAKKFKKQPREKTFFDTAIRNHYENPTTELLEFFLNPRESHELGDVFWKGFSDIVQAEVGKGSQISIGQIERLERECVTHSGNRIDLMLETDSHLLLVEAKIYHHQNNPFHDYVKYAKTRTKGKETLGWLCCINM